MRSQSSGFETSAAIAVAPSSAPAASIFSAVREASVSSKPSSRSILAIASPMPEEPPVINADGTRFDYLRNAQGLDSTHREPGPRYPGSSSPLSATAAPRPPSRISRAGKDATRILGRVDEPHLPRAERRLRREVPGGAARGAAARLRAGRGREPARRARALRRRRRLQARRRARARLHARLLPAARRRPGALRPDRGDERAQRRLRDGRLAAARALDRRLPGEPAERDARRDLRRRRRAGARGRRDPRRRPHAPRRRAEVRARGRRHRAPGRLLGEERRPAGRRALPDEAARHGDAPARRPRGTAARGGARRRRPRR